ncbi:GINS complex subunit 4 [Heterostelium album PN500]|uniref:GINS complex subunit 4 n=1 Tax=Heterostelium pallidum (strain ATCC 26659 / Pp 5 / PN500) TaxID=670386 RepID=D3BG83_HETP5|nr:GINS complex subunit 4 [Heterostelium album PN500]EFA79483.1 GINS complex subunit 4 [Heterostelium album PN500]|eukprot:XP_020431604.1 GINS complex subunit 4 [Heterostelium album PN500]
MNVLDENILIEVNKLQKLKQSWINEKSTPDILPYRRELVSDIMEEIQTKEELCTSDIKNPAMQFTANIYEMEIERLKYLIKSYLRTRLQKKLFIDQSPFVDGFIFCSPAENIGTVQMDEYLYLFISGKRSMILYSQYINNLLLHIHSYQ